MVTDPPYGVSYDASWRTAAGLQQRGAHGKVSNDHRADWREVWALFPGPVAYVWHGALHCDIVAESLRACGFEIRAQIIWIKSRFAISRGAYHWAHEPAYYAARQAEPDHWRFEDEHENCAYGVKGSAAWRGGRRQSTVWEIDNGKIETAHSTQKPLECMRRPLLNNSKPGDAVYDPFLGSGTTLCAAEQTERVCFGIELNPAYVDVAIKRWSAMTGEDALREADGARWSELEPR